ncbi:MAG TPA: hypothetical protein VJ201_00855 [Candidatus Babeliales bacterium]|nr:hypothetical protein [Candidatus Babeliales bacterium]
MLRKFSLNKNLDKFLVCLLFISGIKISHGSELVLGNVNDNGARGISFDCPIGDYLFSQSTGHLYVTLLQEGSDTHKLASALRTDKLFSMLPSHIVSLDSKNVPATIGQINSTILHLALLDDRPVLVDSRFPDTLFWQSHNHEWISTTGQAMHDVDGKKGEIKALSTNNKDYIFAFVSPEKKQFGDVGSGIALVNKIDVIVNRPLSNDEMENQDSSHVKNYKQIIIPKLRVVKRTLKKEKNITSQENKNSKQKNSNLTKSVTIPFDGSHDAVKIGDMSAIIKSVTAIHWDEKLQRLYIGLHAKSSDNGSSGVRSIVVGRLVPQDMATFRPQDFIFPKYRGRKRSYIDKKKYLKKRKKIKHALAFSHVTKSGKKKIIQLILDPIASSNCFDSKTDMIGAVGAGKEFIVSHLKTMHTSTLLDYLIACDGQNGTVHALPLVNENQEYRSPKISTYFSSTHGTVAAGDSLPRSYAQKKTDLFNGRAFLDPVIKENMPKSGDQAVLVGGGALPQTKFQAITTLLVVSDAVFVSIAGSYEAGFVPGIYHSQALFDEFGRIVSWSKWRRILTAHEPIYGMVYDEYKGAFWYLGGEKKNIIKRMLWSDGIGHAVMQQDDRQDQEKNVLGANNENQKNLKISEAIKTTNANMLSRFLGHIFVSNKGESVSLFDQTNQCGASYMLALGSRTCAMIETSCVQNGLVVPIEQDYLEIMQQFKTGVVEGLSNRDRKSAAFVFSGGELEALGELSAISCVNDGKQGWLCVGGVHGLAVLSTSEGAGGSSLDGLGVVRNGMKFRKVGDFKFVKKIVNDGKYLYVLTRNELSRINLETTNFGDSGKVDLMLLARSGQKEFLGQYTSFADVIISGRFAVLATSKGLYRVGNGSNIMVQDFNSLSWKPVLLRESVGPVQRLVAVTSTGREQDVAYKGQLYVLTGHGADGESQLYRLFINDDQAEITDSTVGYVPDYLYDGKPLFFVVAKRLYNGFFYDGTSIWYTPSVSSNAQGILINQLPNKVFVRSEKISYVSLKDAKNSDQKSSPIKLGSMVRCSGSGSLLVPTDHGVFVFE